MNVAPETHRSQRKKKWPSEAEEARIESIALFERIQEECDRLADFIIESAIERKKVDPDEIIKKLGLIKGKAQAGSETLKKAKGEKGQS